MNRAGHVTMFDTTLRDGQQCPGAGMSFDRCIEYAHLAHELRIDVLEAGFPSASKVDFDIVRTIAAEVAPLGESPVIAGLCQLRDEQIDVTMESLQPAIPCGKARLHVYLPIDPNLMKASLGERAENKQQLVRDVHAFVERAVKGGLEVEFSPEGYSRMGDNFDFVTDTIRAAVSAGATVINCPDTIGGACFLEGEEYFVEKMKRHAEIIEREFPGREITWSVHCHNDFGMAVQNALNGVLFGPARQIEGCINGIGERAGNTALEQCIMIIRHFPNGEVGNEPWFTRANIEHLQKISDFVNRYMLPRQPHWPIGGENAAKHSSGGHTNAVLRNPLVYQPFDPRETGKEITLLFGPLSGGNHAKAIIERYGYACSDGEKAAIAQHVKDLYSERRKGITDNELLEGYFDFRKPIAITDYDYSKHRSVAEVHLTGRFFDEEGVVFHRAEGKDSALATLKGLIDQRFPGLNIHSYGSESVGTGISATSRSSIVVINEKGELFEGRGADQDIEISAMKALIDAVNRAFVDMHFRITSGEQ